MQTYCLQVIVKYVITKNACNIDCEKLNHLEALSYFVLAHFT